LQKALPIQFTLRTQPTAGPTPRRVMVRPMQDAAFVVPDIFAAKGKPVARRQAVEPGRDISVMGDKDDQSRRYPQEKSLMPRPFVVIWQDFHHFALAMDRRVINTFTQAFGGLPIGKLCAWAGFFLKRGRIGGSVFGHAAVLAVFPGQKDEQGGDDQGQDFTGAIGHGEVLA